MRCVLFSPRSHLRFKLALLAALCLGFSTYGSEALGRQPDAAPPVEPHPLASKEEMIRDRFNRFLDRVYRLQDQLSKTEPENAAKLARVIERAGELGLAEQLDQLIALLRNSASLTEALDAQGRWVRDVDRLMAILLERDSDDPRREQQIMRLETYKRQLDRIVQMQEELRGNSVDAAETRDMSQQNAGSSRPSEDEEWDSAREAKKQRSIASMTRELGDKMRSDAAAGGKPTETPKPGQSAGSSTPGLQRLDSAHGDMGKAAEALESDNPAQAASEQDSALDELNEARKELEQALNQLRREERQETLRNLEARFRDMLSKQTAINAATVRLDEIGREAFRRAETLELADLATKEKELSREARLCGHVLDEEGTTVVFPRFVGALADDMASLAGRLGALHVGRLTQQIEQEVVDTLEQFLEAIKKMQQANEQQQGSIAGNPGDSPLLPASAELKLLRSSQVRISARTAAIEAARTEATEPDDTLAELLATAAAMQAQCAQVAREMRERHTLP
ncbi:MAG: DUF4175 family protein [Phycisphaerae bacterium]